MKYYGFSEGHFSRFIRYFRQTAIYKDADTGEYFILENDGELGVNKRIAQDKNIENIEDAIIINKYLKGQTTP